MKIELITFFLALLLWSPLQAGYFAKEGSELYLLRSGTETYRAEFEYPEDCQHIAKIMNKAEPLVKWYCK